MNWIALSCGFLKRNLRGSEIVMPGISRDFKREIGDPRTAPGWKSVVWLSGEMSVLSMLVGAGGGQKFSSTSGFRTPKCRICTFLGIIYFFLFKYYRRKAHNISDLLRYFPQK